MKNIRVRESNTIYISDIPKNHNNIPDLYRHFSKYGHIQSIWAAGSKASIIFETIEDARAAVQSSEAYAGNRFIGINFHNNPNEAYSDLRRSVNMDKIKNINNKVCLEIDREMTKSLVQRYRMVQSQIDTTEPKLRAQGEIAKLQTASERIINEAVELMSKLDSSSKEEKEKIKERINGLNKNVIEINEKIEELQRELI